MASRAEPNVGVGESASYAKRMSNHVAFALVVYTLALIFEVSPQMVSKDMSILPYFMLVVLVGLAILPCRNLERRWALLDRDGRGDHKGEFKRDIVLLWLAAIGIPTGLMLLIWIIP
jgi:hypothetical protein